MASRWVQAERGGTLEAQEETPRTCGATNDLRLGGWDGSCILPLTKRPAELPMRLLDLASTNPAAFEGLNISQIVGICGDGQLLDGSKCSEQLRSYLALQKPPKLAEYARYCLDVSFNKSGAVLQDVLNEMGRRLGFSVVPGRYTGSVREIGFDGLWIEGDAALVVEAKTTDAYRINLDKVVEYAVRAKATGLVDSEPKVLLVVGREDTGDLEAQIRGSRHAWQVRLVSLESLIRLMFVRDEVSAQTFTEKIRRILFPFEYTRVDHIIDLVFATQREVEEKIVESDAGLDGGDNAGEKVSGAWQFTPAGELESKRSELLQRFYGARGLTFRRVTRGKYLDDAKNVRVTCTISKRYERDYQPYWYAFHPAWMEFLIEGSEGFLLLGCMDRHEGYALPAEFVRSKLDSLNKTEKADRYYWHLALQLEGGQLLLNMTKTGERISIEPFRF